MTAALAFIVFAGLVVLGLGILGRRGADRIRLVILGVLLISPAAFGQGLQRFIARETKPLTRFINNLPGTTMRTSTTIPAPP